MIKSGYHLFKSHAKFIILAGLATVVVQLLLQLIQDGAQTNRGGMLVGLIVGLFVALIGIIITIGWSKVLLKISRGEGAVWNDFKSQPALWLRFIKGYLWYIGYFVVYAVVASIIFIIIAVIGLATHIGWLSTLGLVLGAVAFVLVSIYFSIKYQFLKYVILDNPEMRSRDTFRRAGAITKGSLVQLLGFAIVLGLVNLLGLICIVIGLIVSIPTTKIAQVKVYDFLKEKYSA
jgi:hypothetical protein